MQVFAAEKDAGLESLLSAKGSARVCAALRLGKSADEKSIAKLVASIGSVESLVGHPAKDLAVIDSILVSTGWNLNDDVFTPEDTWAARATPAHKPINVMHDETQIIGHMITSKAVNKDGSELGVEDTSKLPQDFDLEVAGVLYKELPAIAEKVAKIIEDANKGEAFVSMEVWFDDFDYAIRNPSTGETKIVPRTAESAFLTKHLRSYGGNGKYETYLVGRVLRQLEFAGKGIVDSPANPESVIKEAVAKRAAAQVNSTTEPRGGVQGMAESTDKTAPKVEDLQVQLTEAQNKLAEAQKSLETKATECKAATAALDELKGKGLDKQVEALTASVTAKDGEIKTLTAAKVDGEAKLAEATKRAEAVEKELADIRKMEKARTRMAELAKVKKIDKEEATLAELKDMSDETFAMILKYAGNSAAAESGKTDKGGKGQAEAATAALETAQAVTEPDLTVASETQSESNAKVAKATAMALFGRKSEEE